MDIPAPDISAATLMVWTWATEFLPHFATALVLVIGGFIVAGWLGRIVARAVDGSRRLDPTFAPVLATIVRYAVLAIVLIAALGQLGVETTSLLAALGAIGLAIGLALQGTLSNIAAGLMLLWLRPFRAGEYIDTGEIAGTVREIGLFVTVLDTFDGIYRFVPNSQLWNTPVLNYSRNPRRMADMSIGIAQGADIEAARRIMLDLAASDKRVASDPAPDVFVEALGSGVVTLKYRVWIPTAVFWPTQRYLIEEVKRRFDAAGIEIPFPQRVVHMTTLGQGVTAAGMEEAALPAPREGDKAE